MAQTAAARVSLLPPRDIAQITAGFGDIFAYIHAEQSRSAMADRATCHAPSSVSDLSFLGPLAPRGAHNLPQAAESRLRGSFSGDTEGAGLQSKLTSFGGCFSFRLQRTGTKLSTHSWGIAVDLNPESNVQGTAGDMDPSIVRIFTQTGFSWGGGWRGRARDPMHFQFCTGY